MAFAKIHVFPYSTREGTPAATMPGQVPEPVKKERGERLRLLSDELSRRWRNRFTGQERPVLWEERSGPEQWWSGLTDNYLRVYTASAADLHNQITPVRLLELAGEGDADVMLGRIVR